MPEKIIEQLENLPAAVSSRKAFVTARQNYWMGCFKHGCCRARRSGGQNSKDITLRTHRVGR